MIAYLNLTRKQYTDLGEAASKSKPLKLHLVRTQFVDEEQQTNDTIQISLTKAQVDKLKRKELVITLTAAQCKKTVENIKKVLGGALPLLALGALPWIMKGVAALGAIGAAAGGASQIANAVNNKKFQDKTLEEAKRHNQSMEQKTGQGFFLGQPPKGRGLYLSPRT